MYFSFRSCRAFAAMRSSFVVTVSPPLGADDVSLLCLTICRLLPSGGITRPHWYYETIRLPAAGLPSSLWAVVRHTLSLTSQLVVVSLLRKQQQGLPGCRVVSMSRMPWSSTPRKPATPRHYGVAGVDFRTF